MFHKGLGSVADRNFRPHVTCFRRTPDGKFVMAADSGLDQVKIYRFNERDEHMVQVDAIRCDPVSYTHLMTVDRAYIDGLIPRRTSL